MELKPFLLTTGEYSDYHIVGYCKAPSVEWLQTRQAIYNKVTKLELQFRTEHKITSSIGESYNSEFSEYLTRDSLAPLTHYRVKNGYISRIGFTNWLKLNFADSVVIDTNGPGEVWLRGLG